MKTTIILREFSELSRDEVQSTCASALSITESSQPPPSESGELGDHFREMMNRRYTTPLMSAIPYRHWGINE